MMRKSAPFPSKWVAKAVSQKVRINVRFQSGSFRMFFHNLPDAHSRQFGAAGGKKNFVAGAE